MAIKLFVVAFSLILFGVNDSLACTCGVKKSITKEDVDRSDMIFLGEVLRINEGPKRVTKYGAFETVSVTFKVLQPLKIHPDSLEATVITYEQGSMCGVYFKKGEKWYISTEQNSWVSLCGRSVKLSKQFLRKSAYTRKQYRAIKNDLKKIQKRAKEDIKFILALQSPK